MPLQATSGAASYDAFGGGVPVAANYIEDVFSTWLYTGNGSTQTINNGIDLAGKGGLVWIKQRDGGGSSYSHVLTDTVRGVNSQLFSNLTNAASGNTNAITAFNAGGFSLGSYAPSNFNAGTFASWTFRKQPKFFDVVTYTGNGNTGSGQQIAHNLGSTPGCIIIKSTSGTGTWLVYHRSVPSAAGAGPGAMFLNTTAARSTTNSAIGFTNATVFSVGENTATVSANTNGVTYVAYLFAHNAGGFGLSGTDNVISCGSFTTDGSGNATVSLGYEPQWVLYKPSTAVNNWKIFDNMRGMVVGNGDQALYPNTSGAEVQDDSIQPAATGFSVVGGDASATHIYIAIRRGPMKVPTTGTSVFAPTVSSAATGTALTTNFPIDLQMAAIRDGNSTNTAFSTRLIGVNSTPATVNNNYLVSSSAGAELTASFTRAWNNTGFQMPSYLGGSNDVFWSFQRAPGFFDVVCYTGTGSARTVAHNLGVAPELIIVKSRSSGTLDWLVYSAPTGNANALLLNTTDASFGSTSWGSTTPTASVFSTGASGGTNNSGATFVAYLFASCPGVSRVGSYTGNDNTAAQGGQTINCGFTGSARFILIKCTSSAENWYVWDSARGIVPGNDPSLTLNTTAAEDAGYDAVDAVAGGFIVNNNNASNLNTSGQSYIFLAIA